MFGILDYIKLGSAAIVGGLTVWLFVITIHEPLARRDERAKATAQCETDKSQMVDRAIADALAATLAQERRYRNAADIAAADAQKRAGEALRAKEEADERVRALQAEAERDNLPTWTPEELKWLGAH